MPRLIGRTVFLAVLGLAAACSPAAPPPPPAAGPAPSDEMEMIGAANALDQQFMDAFNKGDVNGVMALYWNSPDLAFYTPDAMGLRGWAAANAAMTATFKSRAGAKLEILESRNDVEGTVVLGSGRWKLTIPAAKGPATVVEGRYTDVKAQKDGRWVYLVDHASVPLPPGAGTGRQ